MQGLRGSSPRPRWLLGLIWLSCGSLPYNTAAAELALEQSGPTLPTMPGLVMEPGEGPGAPQAEEQPDVADLLLGSFLQELEDLEEGFEAGESAANEATTRTTSPTGPEALPAQTTKKATGSESTMRMPGEAVPGAAGSEGAASSPGESVVKPPADEQGYDLALIFVPVWHVIEKTVYLVSGNDEDKTGESDRSLSKVYACFFLLLVLLCMVAVITLIVRFIYRWRRRGDEPLTNGFRTSSGSTCFLPPAYGQSSPSTQPPPHCVITPAKLRPHDDGATPSGKEGLRDI